MKYTPIVFVKVDQQKSIPLIKKQIIRKFADYFAIGYLHASS